MQLGKRIKELRIENNLTQEELAEQLDVSAQAVSKWETNCSYPDITLLPILANMFGVSVDFLLDVDVKKKEAEINEIIEEYSVLLNQGKTDENLILLEEAIKKAAEEAARKAAAEEAEEAEESEETEETEA